MPTISAIQTPEGFLAECRKRGIKLAVKGETIKATGKPPAKPEAFAAFLRAKKPELLALLRTSEGNPHGGKTAHYSAPNNFQAEALEPPLVAWAVEEAKEGTLPELSEPLTLPSRQIVPADGAAAWLIAAQSRATSLSQHSEAFAELVRDMEALARWARDAWLWLHSPVTHQGAYCSLGQSYAEEIPA